MKILKKSCAALIFAVFAHSAFAASGTSSAKSASSGGVKSVEREQASAGDSQFAASVENALLSGSIEDALALFESHQTDDPGLLSLKSSLLLSSGNVKEADKIATELLKKNPDSTDALELNIMVAKQKGDAVKKGQHLRKLIKIDPANVVANMEFGDEQSLKKNYGAALRYYRTAWQSEPENTEALFCCGKMSYYLSKDRDAKNFFNRLLKVDPNNSQALSYLGKIEGENKMYKAARDYTQRAIDNDPENSDLYLDLGTFSRYLGKYDAAEAAWKKAAELDPDYFLAYAYLAGLYDELERDDEAYECYIKVAKRNPKYYYAYEAIGLHAWRRGDYEMSGNAFKEAAKYNPESISYPLMATACSLKLKNVKAAKDYSDSVLRKITDRTSLDYKILRMYHDQIGDNDVTLAIQKAGSNASSGSVTNKNGKYLYYLALYYEMKGNTSLAQKYYSEVCAIQTPLFFEYRLAKWAKSADSDDAVAEAGKTVGKN